MTRLDQFQQFAAQLTAFDLDVPKPISRGIDLHARLAAEAADPAPLELLAATDEEAIARLRESSLRLHEGSTTLGMRSHGLRVGLSQLTDQLVEEITTATVPLLDGIIEDLQPQFDAAVAPLVTGAQQFGFTWNTTSDEVIDRDDPDAPAAWKAARDAWHAADRIVELRRSMSTLFGLAPTDADVARLVKGSAPDGRDDSVWFAASANWDIDGRYYVDANLGAESWGLNWFAMAIGGLHLNTPTEVDAKIAARPAPSTMS